MSKHNTGARIDARYERDATFAPRPHARTLDRMADEAWLAGYPDTQPCAFCHGLIARSGACGCSPYPLAEPWTRLSLILGLPGITRRVPDTLRTRKPARVRPVEPAMPRKCATFAVRPNGEVIVLKGGLARGDYSPVLQRWCRKMMDRSERGR